MSRRELASAPRAAWSIADNPDRFASRVRAHEAPSRIPQRWKHVLYCLVLLAMPVVYLASVRSSLSAPFWFDEQWVANNLSLPGHFWIIPIQNQAPVAAGWFFLARGVSLLVGSTESTLRSVGAAAFIAAFPLIFFYSRRFVGNFTAFVFAPLVMFSSLILSYVLQLL